MFVKENIDIANLEINKRIKLHKFECLILLVIKEHQPSLKMQALAGANFSLKFEK